MCQRELSTLFAHFVQEVGDKGTRTDYQPWQQGLHYVTETNCSLGGADYLKSKCDYESSNWSAEDDAWPPQADVQYFGRGCF